ncbi:MAG: DUF6382 domain-containing protein [Clostridiaceae bacterium]|nr:DUF6382 domain-containing protein [Clostridiaceae bacterium]
MKNILLDFEYSFNNNAGGSYLILKINGDNKILNHQAEILCQNPNSAFLPFYVRRENDSTFICYNITSKISLSQYIERKSLNKKELLDLLRNIARNLMLSDNYLLDLSGFILQPEFVFINPATAEASLIYVPVSYHRNPMEGLRTFLINLVINTSNSEESTRDNYLQRILNSIKSDTFNLVDFNRFIIDLRNSGEPYECEKNTVQQEAVADMDTLCRSPKDKAHEYATKNKRIRSAILLQPVFLIVVAIVCLLMVSQQIYDIISISGVVLIAAALDYLAVKKITANQDKREIIDNHHMESDNTGHREGCGHKRVFSSTELVRACDTIIISEASQNCYPYLESIGSHRIERIIIDKNKLVIGRLASMADHIMHEDTIGKLHAEITICEGTYYIKDLNSKNGTFVNGIRVPGNKEFEIKENDIIKFSNYEYVFRQQYV